MRYIEIMVNIFKVWFGIYDIKLRKYLMIYLEYEFIFF